MISTAPATHIPENPGISYLTDVGPGLGRRRGARSWLHTDAPTMSLNGPWQFRLLPGAPGTPGGAGVLPDGEGPVDMADPGYDDSDWGKLCLPCHWVLAGDGAYGHPIYTNVKLPFPQDPPNPPDENPTGDHRRAFALPESWTDTSRYEAIVLRFDGVESRYSVWVNGAWIGAGTGSRLASEFDITDVVHPGDNTIAVRVHQWSASTYVEDQDQWWLPGIFRDVTLQARPVGGLEDVWVGADYDHRTGAGLLTTELTCDRAAFPVRLRAPELGVDQVWQSHADVAEIALDDVRPWSAEQPNLYDATVTSAGGETISLRVGFRRVEIRGDRFLINGARVVFHGMNRHEIRADAGRVFDEDFARADLALMKRHNVNAMRTSHYPPHPRLLDLADELGLWVILENDLETHCFHHGGGRDEWYGNPSEDPAWRPAYLDRMRRTVERDKNHPSIVMWSLGNESGTGANLAAMAQWVRSRDPGRPVHYEGDHAGAYTDVYSRMYPSVPEVESIGRDSTRGLLDASGAESAQLRSRPFLMCEYAHAMGNGPGGLDRYEGLVDQFPRLHGGFVWEWRDHGLASRTADGRPFFAYGGDFGEAVHDGPFCVDGMVLSDGTPSPGLAEFAAVSAPIRFSMDGRRLAVENRRHDASTDDLTFGWRLDHDGRQVAAGTLELAPLAAGNRVDVDLPQLPIADHGETWLTATAALSQSVAWAEKGHAVATTQFDLTPVRTIARLRPPALPPGADAAPVDGPVRLGPAVFRDGRLTELCGQPVTGPRLELWRAPTANDGGSHMPSHDEVDASQVWGISGPQDRSHADLWREAGLDLLTGRLLEVSRHGDQLVRRTRYGTPDHREWINLEETWQLVDDSLWLRLEFIPSSRWEVDWPRLGARLDLPLTVDECSWFGTGPQESYRDCHHAALVGRYRSKVEDLSVNYAVPQETGHRPGMRSLEMDLEGSPWLKLETVDDQAGRLPGFTLSRWTAQQLTAAGHPFELPVPTATHLYLDAAQSGLGSRACGPDVWPDSLVRPQARSITLSITEA